MSEDSVDSRSVALSNYEQLVNRLEQTTDPAQVVVLESCLAELKEEMGLSSPTG